MMEKKFTPGPWVATSVDGGWDGVRPADRNLPVCNLAENNPANMYLIAAAPELYVALEQLLLANPVFRLKPVGAANSIARMEQIEAIKAEDFAKSALAKARGEA